jgi:hypothetical protein
MRRSATSVLMAIAALLLVALAAFVSYDMRVFQPRRAQLQALLQQASPEERAPPASIRRYLLASDPSGQPPSAAVARMLVARFGVSRGGMLAWHAHTLLWERLLLLHLSQDEILALYGSLSYNGFGHGLSGLSQRLYAKPLRALSDPEAATVVAVLWAPVPLLRDAERLERRRALLMERARAAR